VPAAPTDPTPAAPQRPAAVRPAPTAAGPQPEPAAANASAAPAPAPPSAVGGDLVAVFDTVVRPGLKGMAKALYVVAQPKGVRNGALVIGFPNQGHADKAGQYRADIEKALSAAVGAAVTVVIEADAAAATTPAAAEAPDPIDHEVDLSDLQSAPPQEQGTHLDRIASSFPGSTFVEGSA